MEFKSSDFKWDTYDGETSGVFGNYDYEIGISARPTAKDIRWGSQDTNVRSWILEADGKVIEAGMADGLQACKKAAIEALNNHVSRVEVDAMVRAPSLLPSRDRHTRTHGDGPPERNQASTL